MLKKITLSCFLILSLFVAAALSCPPVTVGDLTISEHRWIRPSTGPNTAAYLTITSKQNDKLIKVDCKEAETVELHNHIDDNGVMKMRPVEFIAVGKDPVSLKPGSLHIMLMGLKDSFQGKSAIPLTLHFEKAGPVTLDFDVKVPKTKERGASS
ncbi:MAG: copper chaperone PCu(A)C [Alphaproteobacteria bacterium]|jgi:copper(I)-binding protein|nr:copper chaperone PCu(A)C [Alphaproteobacteria bacterium]